MPALCGLMIGGELNSLFSFDDNRPAYRRSKLSQRHHFIDNVSAERLPCHFSRRRSWHLPLDQHQPLQTHHPQALARRLRSQKNPGKTKLIEMNFFSKKCGYYPRQSLLGYVNYNWNLSNNIFEVMATSRQQLRSKYRPLFGNVPNSRLHLHTVGLTTWLVIKIAKNVSKILFYLIIKRCGLVL